jgi:hypothetical protein
MTKHTKPRHELNSNNWTNNLVRIFRPILISVSAFCAFVTLLFLEITILNQFGFVSEKISLEIKPQDILVGFLIYIKTSIDFAIFISILMSKYPGLKNRFAIEVGTGFGNVLGTMVVLAIWIIFKEIAILLGIMVLVASLVLLEMADGAVEHLNEVDHDPNDGVKVQEWQKKVAKYIHTLLQPILYFISPVLGKVMPKISMSDNKSDVKKSFWGLFVVSMSVPFILGLDDFAGYVPAFNVVNVFGFGIGVILGHSLLNIALFLSPKFTIRLVKNPNVALLGAAAFIGLAIYGLIEAFKILFGLHH